MKKYALIGKDIEKSLSPIIHKFISEITGVSYTYEILDVDDKNLKEILFDDKYSGFNITKPYKTKVKYFVDELSKFSKESGSINTLKKIDNKIQGYTTDGMGFVKSFEFLDISLENKNILIYGTGGASKSIIRSLLDENVRNIYITGRNLSEKVKIYNSFKHIDESKIFPVDSYSGLVCDIVVNTTSVDDDLSIDVSNITTNFAYDIIYDPTETKFLRLARELGIETKNGIDMLIIQAYLSFCIWNDRKPIKDEILKVLANKREIIRGL